MVHLPESYRIAVGIAEAAGRQDSSSANPSFPLTASANQAKSRRNDAHEIVAAALASGMISASGKPHTPAEAVAVFRDVLAVLRQADQD